jgi:antirestriction protein ArdC
MSRISHPEIWTAEKIIDLIKDGHLPPWAKSWSTSDAQDPRSLFNPKIPYRGLNYMLLRMVSEMYDSPFFITPKQLFSIKGTTILEGENKKTWPVFFFSKTESEDDDGNKKSVWFCKGYRVYNIRQTLGIPESKIPVLPEPETFEHTPIEACEIIVRGYKQCPELVHKGQRASYNPAQDLIRMPARNRFKGAEEYYSTLFHEMVHSTGHKDRLNRETIQSSKFASHSYSQEELVAEFGAAMLCGKAGIAARTIENSAAYISGWSKALNPEVLVLGSREARKAFEYIVGQEDYESTNQM